MGIIDTKNTIIKIFYCILFCFPFLIACYYSLSIIGGQSVHFDYEKYLLLPELGEYRLIPFILSLLTICCIFVLFYFSKTIVKNSIVLVILVFFITFIPRFLLYYLFYENLNLFDDFFSAWKLALGDNIVGRLNYYIYFPTYMNFSFFLKIICSHFSDYNSIRIIIFSSIVFNVLTAIGIFWVGKIVFKDINISFLASIIYALSPSGIFYSLTSSPEHLCICCNVFAIYLLFHVSLNFEVSYFNIIKIVLSGILFGVANSIKFFFSVILVALCIGGFLYSVRKTTKDKKRVICFFLILVLAEHLTMHYITSLTEKSFSVSLSLSDSTPHYLCVGLNRQGEGQIHIGSLSRDYIKLRMSGHNRKDAYKIVKNKINDDWIGNTREILPFLFAKTKWAWQDDCISIAFFTNRIIRVEDEKGGAKKRFYNNFDYTDINVDSLKYHLYRRIKKYASTYSEIYYFILMCLGFVSCIVKIKRRKTLNFEIFVNDLIIEGFFCLLLITEAQARYKCLILPFICLHVVFSFLKKEKTLSENTLKNKPAPIVWE